MTIRIIIFKILFFSTSVVCFGQIGDTVKILFSSKLNVVNFTNNLFDEDLVKKIPFLLNDTTYCKATVLESVGFKEVIFIKVSFADENFYELLGYPIKDLENKNLDAKQEIYFSDFVLAYYPKKNKFYKIKGFVNNEFDMFYYDYSISANNLEKETLRNQKSFLQNYKVDGIDLDCLYEAIHLKKKPSLKDYPCLEPNYTRMVLTNGVPYYY